MWLRLTSSKIHTNRAIRLRLQIRRLAGASVRVHGIALPIAVSLHARVVRYRQSQRKDFTNYENRHGLSSLFRKSSPFVYPPLVGKRFYFMGDASYWNYLILNASRIVNIPLRMSYFLRSLLLPATGHFVNRTSAS